MPGIKWADDFNNGVPGAKPIVFAEGCSEYNQKNSIFESPEILRKSEANQGKGKVLTENGYMGVKCGCYHGRISNDTGMGMNHAKVHSDPFIVKFITNSLLNEEKAEEMHPDYLKFSHEQWDEFEGKCLLFTTDRTLQTQGTNEKTT